MLARLIRTLRTAAGRSRFESELDAELEDHIAKRTDDLVEQGMSAAAAARRARREFGPDAWVKDAVRDSKGLALVDPLLRNVKYAGRSLGRSPAFALTAIGTLALCIAANTAIFSVVDAMFFRPLPYPEPDRLGRVYHEILEESGNLYLRDFVDGPTWEWMRDRVTTLDLAVRSGAESVNLGTRSGSAEFADQMRVSAGFFRVLGVPPSLGREFAPEEDVPGGPPLVVLSHGLWTRLFDSGTDAVGESVLLRGEPYTVIGVMPEGFRTVPDAALWTPLGPSTRGEGGGLNYELLARVRPGSTPEEARAELDRLAGLYDGSDAAQVNTRGQVRSMGIETLLDALSAENRRPVFLLWTAVAAVLLIGCINLAGLVLARTSAGRHEIATRLALGSGRRAIVGQLLVESATVGLAGGVLGLLLGHWTVLFIRPMLTDAWEPPQAIAVDLRVLVATAAVTLVTIVLFGLYPAFEASRTDLRSAMGSGSRWATRRSRRMRSLLVAGEITLAFPLLVGAGLVLRTLDNWLSLDPGFEVDNVLTASLSLDDARYAAPESVLRLFETSLAGITRSPEVQAAGIGLTLPYERALNMGAQIVDGPSAMPERRVTDFVYATPGYFEALRFRLLEGRWFTERDRTDSPPVALVNEAYARMYFRDDRPLGRHINMGSHYEIVGLVGDVQQRSNWGSFGVVGNAPTIYLPAAQAGESFDAHRYFSPHWVVRTTGPAPGLPVTMREAVASVDPQLPFAEFRWMEEVQSGAFTTERLHTMLLGSFAGLALVLASIGIYGLIAQSVVERTREFGIRLALGAPARSAVANSARPGMVLALTGVVLGSGLALASGRLIESMLFGVSANDVATFVAVGGLLFLAAGIASLLPSMRIARLDPAKTLREE